MLHLRIGARVPSTKSGTWARILAGPRARRCATIATSGTFAPSGKVAARSVGSADGAVSPKLHEGLERAMLRFRRTEKLQKFVSVHAQVHNHLDQERHFISREQYQERRSAALAEWRAVMA